jgi:hypothetical protein
MANYSLISESLDDFALKTCVGSNTPPKLPAASGSRINSGFVAGQLLAGSLVPSRASIVTPHCTQRWQLSIMPTIPTVVARSVIDEAIHSRYATSWIASLRSQ